MCVPRESFQSEKTAAPIILNTKNHACVVRRSRKLFVSDASDSHLGGFHFTLTEWAAVVNFFFFVSFPPLFRLILTCWQIVFRTYFAYTSKLAVSMETLRPSDMSSRPAGCDSPEPLSSASPEPQKTSEANRYNPTVTSWASILQYVNLQ